MPKQQVRVTFQPSGRTIVVLPRTTALEVAAQAGLTIQTPCGGSGTCGKCRVQFTSGACEPTAADSEQLSDDEIAAGWRLACQTSICQDCVIPSIAALTLTFAPIPEIVFLIDCL